MKIIIVKNTFLKSWNIAASVAAASAVRYGYSNVKITAAEDGTTSLQATDTKTSVIRRVEGVKVIEPGEALMPVKHVSELFEKAGGLEFSLQIDEGRAVMLSGKSKYRFGTYHPESFPKLPASDDGIFFCSLPASKLLSAIERGGICASSGDTFPAYLSCVLLEMKNGILNAVSTDKRRLAVCWSEVSEGGENKQILLPLKNLRALVRYLGTLDTEDVTVIRDAAQAFFRTETTEYGIRMVGDNFPDYAKIIKNSYKTTADFNKSELLSALERIDIIVRDYNRTVIGHFSQNGSSLSASAQEFGEGNEDISGSSVEGEDCKIAVNTRFFAEAVKAVGDKQTVRLGMNGSYAFMCVQASDSDEYTCVIAPVEANSAENAAETGENTDPKP
jgi:DNA polymerase-3 subunit beta